MKAGQCDFVLPRHPCLPQVRLFVWREAEEGVQYYRHPRTNRMHCPWCTLGTERELKREWLFFFFFSLNVILPHDLWNNPDLWHSHWGLPVTRLFRPHWRPLVLRQHLLKQRLRCALKGRGEGRSRPNEACKALILWPWAVLGAPLWFPHSRAFNHAPPRIPTSGSLILSTNFCTPPRTPPSLRGYLPFPLHLSLHHAPRGRWWMTVMVGFKSEVSGAMKRLWVRQAWPFPSSQARAPCPGLEAPGAVWALAQRLLLGRVSERPEEVRGVARSLVGSVLTALRLRRVPGAQANSSSQADVAKLAACAPCSPSFYSPSDIAPEQEF